MTTGVRSVASYIGDDAPIASLPGARVLEDMPHYEFQYQRKPKRKTPQLALAYHEDPGHHDAGNDNIDRSQHDGVKWVLNKKGFKPCDGFNAGTCTDTTHDNFCWHNSSEVHQCNKCLKTGHGAHQCGKGKGKGGGKKGGKGGKNPGQQGKGKGKGKRKGGGKWGQ